MPASETSTEARRVDLILDKTESIAVPVGEITLLPVVSTRD